MVRRNNDENSRLKRASLLNDRLKAEALEAGEITLEDATGMASRKEQREVNRAVKKAYREDVRKEKEAQRKKQADSGNRRPEAVGKDRNPGNSRGSSAAEKAGNRSERKGRAENSSRTGGTGRPDSGSRSVWTGRSSQPESGSRSVWTGRSSQPDSGSRSVWTGRSNQSESSRTGRSDQSETGSYADRAGKKRAGKRKTAEDRRAINNSRSKADSKRSQAAGGQAEPVKKHRHVLLKFLFSIILLAAVFIVGVFIYFSVMASKMQYVPYQTDYVRGPDVLHEDGVTNILLIGTDSRQGDITDTRSDAMMVLSVNRKKHRLVLTSFLRDSYVTVPGVGQTRLNEAFFHGGPALLVRTIEENYKIGIDYYLHADFFTFVDIIDAFGGVTIEVQQPELEYINGYIAEYDAIIGAPERDGFLPEPDGFGVRNLTGRQALGYSRIRYLGTDFGRTDRQRTVLQALLNKARHSSPLTIIRAAGIVLPQLMTDIPQLTLVRLMMGAPAYLFYDVVQGRCPAEGTWSNALMEGNQEVLAVDFGANLAYLKALIYD